LLPRINLNMSQYLILVIAINLLIQQNLVIRMHPIFEKYFEILLKMFEYDMAMMAQPWMYYTVVPILGYLVFFFVKWVVLTMPMWMPFTIVISAATARRRKS